MGCEAHAESLAVVRQQALTLLLPVRHQQAAAADAWLLAHRDQLELALASSESTHFARVALLPPAGIEASTPLLLFETNFDGSLAAHVADLRRALGPLLDGVLHHAEGYPGSAELPTLLGFVQEAASRAAGYYVAHGGLSVAVVRGDAALTRALQERLQAPAVHTIRANDALVLARELQSAAQRWAVERGLPLGPIPRGLPVDPPGALQVLLGRPLALLLALVLVPVFELADRFNRRKSPSSFTQELREKRDRIGLEEDRFDQNGLVHLAPIKPGRYRLFALRMALLVASAIAARGASSGRLGGSASIHFARWVILPDRRLLFLSHYDGSWEGCVGEYVSKAARGLALIWTHTLWFPRSLLQSFRGAGGDGALKAWARAYQVSSPVWYSAYPELSVVDVLRNARIRELLGGTLTAKTSAELLALL